jgi:hypothetical protein
MTISFARHQFPPTIIRHAVWLYVRFTLSYRDVEDLLAERGLDVSYETVRRWALKFGPMFARELRRRRPRPTTRWHLDEMAVAIAGRLALSHRPFLLLITCPAAGLGFNRFNGLASRRGAAREPLLAGCDNAPSPPRRQPVNFQSSQRAVAWGAPLLGLGRPQGVPLHASDTETVTSPALSTARLWAIFTIVYLLRAEC